jgi:excisionase family DNA binding protein
MQTDLPQPAAQAELKTAKDLFSIGEAAKLLSVSIDTIRRWDRLGKIRVVRTPGGTRLIPRSEIVRLKTGAELAPSKLPVVKEPATPQIPLPTPISKPTEPTPLAEPAVPTLQPPIEPTPTVPTQETLPVETQATVTKPTQSQRLHQKIINGIKYYRPVWYQRWHAHPASRPTHLAILGIVLIAAASLFVYQWFIVPTRDESNKKLAELGKVLAAATPPRILSFQGRLTDENNVPVSEPTNIRFRIYTSTSGDAGDPCANTCK